ncbi:MAG: DUF4258 domain-containing protein [Chloroflexi bacterium]|nr:DUF4258 domain-containing protein [Chloroflexota bacterium]
MFPRIYSYDFEQQVNIHQTLHVQQRMAQRNISMDDLDFVLLYGEVFHRAGAVHVHLRRCDISERWYQQFGRLEGTTADFKSGRNDRSYCTQKSTTRPPPYQEKSLILLQEYPLSNCS